jgi:ABC-2 type transport system ATP-binding protein
MIEAQNLSKHYGPRVAVDNISFTIGKGEVVGFLGPNGAGKTTTMRILTGYLPATAGDARIAGFDVFDAPEEVKKRVGYLPESPPLYPELTVGTYLEFIAELRGFYGAERTRRVGKVLERVGLSGWEKRILGSLSKGYRQRAGLAQALIHEPEVLILDEPTSGLDPTQVLGIRALMQELAATRTVILSTHILSEVEAICPHALIIAGGKLKAAGSIAELKSLAPSGTWYYLEIAGADLREVGSLAGITHVEPIDQPMLPYHAARVRARTDPRAGLFEAACAKGWKIRALEERLPSLEEAFIGVVQSNS